MNTNKMQKAAPFLVAAAAVLWGVLVVFVRKLNAAGFEAMEIVGIRVYGSVFFLCLGIGLLQRKWLKVKVKDCWCFVGTGVFSIVFFSYCYFRNVEVSSVALSSILMYTSPIWVTLLSGVFFREKLSGMKLLSLLLALTGSVLVSGITNGMGYTFLFACIGVLPFIDVSSIVKELNAEPMLWIWAICISLFTTCLSFSLYTLGLQYMEPGRAAVLATLEPIVSTVVGVFYYDEPLTVVMVLGIILVLVSSILISRNQHIE